MDDLAPGSVRNYLRQENLLSLLNTARNDGEVHAVPQRDDGMHDGSIMGIVGQAMYKNDGSTCPTASASGN